jgi:serine/threonine protein kinase
MSEAWPSPDEIELDWPASDDACEYRLVLRGVKTGDMRKVSGNSPRFIVPTELIDPAHPYEWKVQHRDALEAPWRNLSPYLVLPMPAETSAPATVIEWPDRGAPAYRLVIEDRSLGETIVKAGVRGTEYILDWSILDLRHVYHYRLQAWLDAGWTSLTNDVPFPRTPEGPFEHRVVVEYPALKAFEREAFASIPAHRLDGVRLETGWTIKEQRRSVSPRGGIRRTAAYLADHPDKGEGFLKAFDFSAAGDVKYPTSVPQQLIQDYEDECRTLELCAEKGMTHVVRLLDSGIHSFPNEAVQVPYFVYERAAKDLLTVLLDAGAGNTAWALRVLQQVAIGLSQLHREGIAHLDIKAANVLTFGDGSAKIADLEMTCHQGGGLPEDLPYTLFAQFPPEWLYRAPPQSWRPLCQACDLYHFGSLIRYVFLGASESATPAVLGSATPAVLGKLDLIHHPHSAISDYRSALPFIRVAFHRVVCEFEDALVKTSTDDLVTGDMVEMFRELCDPDPYIRGDPEGRGDLSRQYSLKRYIRRLGLLAQRAESR